MARRTPVDKDWRSWRLRRWWMTLNIVVEAGLIITLTILAWISQTHSGFRDVKYTPVTTLSHISWEKLAASQLRWTLIPALILSLVGICFSTMVTATAERQPYIELNNYKDHAKNAKLTIMLDYPSASLFYSWALALGNHHFFLGFAMLVQLVVSVSLVSLAGNLFRADASQSSSSIPLESLVAFDVSSLTIGTDLQPAIDVASAIHAYGAAFPAWMNTSYAIEPFSRAFQDVSGNISVNTSVYSANLDCHVIDRSDLNMTFIQEDVSSLGEEQISFTDRGCDVIAQSFAVSSDYRTYAVSWYQDCSGGIPIGRNWNDRLGVFLGLYSDTEPNKMTNFITISCIPSYQNASALVTMSFGANSQPQVISITPQKKEEMLSENFEALHSSLHMYTTFDASGTYKSDAFGRTVQTVAQKLSGGPILDPKYALNATETLYATLFAALAETQLMSPLESPRNMQGHLASAITRLYVVVPVACAELALLFLMWICSIGLFVQAYTSTSILNEDPVGLLGKAVVLLRSDIFAFITNVLENNPPQTKVVELVEERYTVNSSICFYGEDPAGSTKKVRIQCLKEKPVQPPTRVARMKKWLRKKRWPRRERPVSPTGLANNDPVASQASTSNTDSASVPSGSLAQADPPVVGHTPARDHIEMINRASTLSTHRARDSPDSLPLLSRNRTA